MVPIDEEDSDYDGIFSHTAEYHACIYGVAAGWLLTKSEKMREEIPAQFHYFIGGILAAWLYLRVNN